MKQGQHLVLVVDDDMAVRESLKFALELEGLCIRTCSGGPELLNDPDLPRAKCVILDYSMPGMDGFEVMAELGARDCRVPVILITSRATAGLRRRATAAGVRHVVEKPLLDSALMESLEDILGAHS